MQDLIAAKSMRFETVNGKKPLLVGEPFRAKTKAARLYLKLKYATIAVGQASEEDEVSLTPIALSEKLSDPGETRRARAKRTNRGKAKAKDAGSIEEPTLSAPESSLEDKTSIVSDDAQQSSIETDGPSLDTPGTAD